MKDLTPLLRALRSLGLLNSDINNSFTEINKKALMEEGKCISVHVISSKYEFNGYLNKEV